MIPLPKPRGFWDYALFGLLMTGMLSSLFWLEASGGFGWPDAALAFGSAGLLVFGIILVRQGEKAKWIKRPTWRVYFLATLGGFALMFGALYADAYLLHRRDLTARRFWHDLAFTIVLIAAMLWSSRRRAEVL